MPRRAIVILALLFLPTAASAQSVPIKTVPVAEGDQFQLFPSERGGMGGVGIALDDRLRDPYANPAKAVRLSGVRFISSPLYYGFGPLGIDGGDGSGRTLPVGALANHHGVFGGLLLAYQELIPNRNRPCCTDESSISVDNRYVFGLGGLQIPGSEWSVGVSAFHGRLNGLEGVSLLYASAPLRQDGTIQQYRAGVFREWDDGHSAEIVFMHHRLDMTHSVAQLFWIDGPILSQRLPTTREEHDKTHSFAVQMGYRHAFDAGWSLGGRLVGDWKRHPKIPNYDLMQIPRDPGNSAAYNAGIGIATTSSAATFGLDLVYEPIWSHTWANAAEPTETVNDEIIPAGHKTVDNHFVFSNAAVRMGVHLDGEEVDFAVGVDLHHISYDLDQINFVEARRRVMDQHWTEWRLSSSVGTEFYGFEVRYVGRLTLGTGIPQVQRTAWRAGLESFASVGADWVVAPSGPLSVDETTVFSHQLILVVPVAR